MTAQIISIPRTGLHQHVARQLRQMLVESQIQPGAKLNERELCQALSVSRTPLREAIKMLAAEGLVELLPNRGAIAVALNETDIRNTFEVMAGLEGMSGELAATRVTDEELAEIRAMHFEMLAAWTRRDLSNYYRINAEVHRAINRAAKNPVLTATYEQVNARLQALRFRSNQDEDKWKRAVKEHEQMVDALAARDAAGLRAVLVGHLHAKRDVVLEQMRRSADHVSSAGAIVAGGSSKARNNTRHDARAEKSAEKSAETQAATPVGPNTATTKRPRSRVRPIVTPMRKTVRPAKRAAR